MLKQKNLIYSLLGLNIILFLGLIFYQPPPTVEAQTCVPSHGTLSGPWTVTDTGTGFKDVGMASHTACFLTTVYGTLEDGAGCKILGDASGWVLRADTHVSGRVECAAMCLD